MNESEANTLAQRLERLERDIRWWKLIGGTALATLCLFTLMGAKSGTIANEIRARNFVLVDSKGKVRAKLGIEKASEGKGSATTLMFYDSRNAKRMTLTAQNSHGALNFWGAKGRHVQAGIGAGITLEKYYYATLYLLEEFESEERKVAIREGRGLPGMGGVTLKYDGKAALVFLNGPGGEPSVHFNASSYPYLSATDKGGALLWQAP